MLQNLEMKKMAYCLQNSGDPYIENLANRIFGDNLLKQNTNENQNLFNKTNALETGSAFNHRGSLFNTIIKTRRSSIADSDEKGNISK